MTKFHKWLNEFFFGPSNKPACDPNKVINMSDYNAAILKQKKTHYPQNSESKVFLKNSI